jgi:hypothetical protein
VKPRNISLLTIAFLLTTATDVLAQQVYEKKDGFAGNTLYYTQSRDASLEGGSFFSGRYVRFKFEALSPVSALVRNPFVLHVDTQTNGWIFISAGDSLQLKIDGGEIIALKGAGSRDSREVLQGDTVLESANWEIPLPVIQQIASAKTVEFRILGDRQNITGSLKGNLLADAQGFAEKTPGLMVVTAPKPEQAEALAVATGAACPALSGTSTSDPPARLGVTYGPVTVAVATLLHLGEPRGIIVASVVDGSVAAGLGIKRGDVLLSAGDKSLSTACDLPQVLATVKKGTALPLHVWRNGVESVLQAQF